jgi:PPP family 3-phenylpropionic acid transporter
MPAPIGLRLALFYGAVFAAIGIHLPFWPLWLEEARGLSPTEIGWVLAAGFWPRVVTNLVVPHFADRFGARRGPMIALATSTLLAVALFAVAHDVWTLLLLSALVGACWAPLLPLGEALALDQMRRAGLAYGPVRLWGSITFIVAAIGAGQWLEAAGAGIVLPLLAAMLLVTLMATMALPEAHHAERPAAPPRLRHLLVEKDFMGLVLAAGLIGVSHAVYYGFATIHWRAAGHGELLIGALWAEGVVAEVVFFAWSGAVIARLGPRRLLILAGALTVLRWTVSAFSTDLWVLIPAQTLHAASFAAVHLAVMHHIQRVVAPELQASAQGVYAVIGGALLFGLLTPVAGWLYGQVEGGAFLAMAILALAGTILALVAEPRGR